MRAKAGETLASLPTANLSPTTSRKAIPFRNPSLAAVEGGQTITHGGDNPAGHTAVAITGDGVYSFGNNVDPGTSLAAYIYAQSSRRDQTVYIIHTTPAQDAAAMAYFKQFHTWRLPPGYYNAVVKDNCSIRSNRALDAAGTPNVDIFGAPMVDNQDLPMQPNIPGSAGARALAAGADVYEIPMGSTALPRVVGGFEPR